MTYHIFHQTRFTYQQWVGFSHNLVRICPRSTSYQKLVDFALEVEPTAVELESYDDIFGNRLYHILVRKPHSMLTVTARSVVEIDPDALKKIDSKRKDAARITYAKALESMNALEEEIIYAKQFGLQSPLLGDISSAMRSYVLSSVRPERSLYQGVLEFTRRIFEDFTFENGFSDISTAPEEVFRAKKGVCQDFAHFMIACLRGIGVCARYVSGYIETLAPEGKEKLFGADASHAWVSVFIPYEGWFEFDPTNNMVPGDRHILLGYGRDYNDISPMQGVVVGSGMSRLEVMVDVSRHEATNTLYNGTVLQK